jgi:hypothetical protein
LRVTYELKIEQKPEYLHCVVTGRNSQETVTRYMQQVMQECAARRCFRVLIEERLEGPRLGTMEVFTMVSAGSKRYQGMLEALAFVDLNAEGGVMRFAEDVAVNRGIPVRVFRTVDGAEKWLLQNLPSIAGSSPAPTTQKPPNP